MTEKKRYRPSRMFLQWCFSYLLISVIALLLILFSGFRYTDVLRENLEYTNAMQLDITRIWLDQKLGLLRSITSKESFSDAISEIQGSSDYDEIPRYSYYLLAKEVSSDVLNYGIEDTYFLYFPSVDAMVSSAYYGQSERFYELHLETYGIAYEDWMEIVNQNYSTTQVFEPEAQDGGEQKYLVLVRPININNVHKVKVNAVLVINRENLVNATNWLSQDSLCIVDRNMNKLVCGDELPEEIVSGLMTRFGEESSQKLTAAEHVVEDGRYISMISSSYENWDIAVVMEERIFSSKILDVQKLIVCIVLVYLGLSAIVITNSAEKHYGRLRSVVDALAKEDPDASDKMSDAYAYIDSNVQKLIRANVGSADVIERQHNAILQELLNTMVTSANASEEVSRETLERNSFPLRETQRYCLLAYRLGEQSLKDEKDPNKVLEMEWFILQNVTEENLQSRNLKDLCFRKGNIQIYAVWAEAGQEAQLLEGIRWAYQYCQSFLAQHFDFRYAVAVSQEHTGIDGMYMAYQEVRRVYQYQQKQGSPDTVLYSDIDLLPRETAVSYPAETENRLRVAVSRADGDTACAQIRELLELNRKNYLSAAAMQFLAGRIMSNITHEAEEMSGDRELVEAQDRILDAARKEDQERVERELCALAHTVCARVRVRNQKAQEDEKRQLYLDIRDYIDAHYQDPGLNVNSVSEYFGKSAPFVSRYFKEMCGINLTQYIHKVRMQHVKEKLMRGERLEDIAVSCGFGSQRSFLRIFKQYEGVTPSQYRELHGSKEDANDENI